MDDEKPRYFDSELAAERLKRLGATHHSPSMVARIRRPIWAAVDGFAPLFLGPFIAFGALFVVVAGVIYGPLVFYGLGGISLVMIGFYVNRKVGRHLRFVEQKFWVRLLATVPAFALMMLILFAMYYFS